MMKSAVLFLILFIVHGVAGQTDLPEYGKLGDLVGKARVYVIADGDHRKAIIKNLERQKELSVVSSTGEADMYIEYRTLARNSLPPSGIQTETGQIDAFYYRDKKKVIAWTNSTTAGGFKGDTANSLIKKFVKERQKALSGH